MDWFELCVVDPKKDIIICDNMKVQYLRYSKKRHYKFRKPDGTLFKGFLSKKNTKHVEPGIYKLYYERQLILFGESGRIYVIYRWPTLFLEMCEENKRKTVNKLGYEDILDFFLI